MKILTNTVIYWTPLMCILSKAVSAFIWLCILHIKIIFDKTKQIYLTIEANTTCSCNVIMYTSRDDKIEVIEQNAAEDIISQDYTAMITNIIWVSPQVQMYNTTALPTINNVSFLQKCQFRASTKLKLIHLHVYVKFPVVKQKFTMKFKQQCSIQFMYYSTLNCQPTFIQLVEGTLR